MDDITKNPKPEDPVKGAEHTAPHHGDNPTVSHEHGDVNVFAISKFGIALAIGTIFMVFLMWGLFAWFYHMEDVRYTQVPSRIISERPKLPPEPRLQAVPRVELKDLRQAEDKVINGYGWIDPDKGIVRIPVDLAMQMVLQKGLPSRPAQPGQADYRELAQKSSSGRTYEKVGQ